MSFFSCFAVATIFRLGTSPIAIPSPPIKQFDFGPFTIHIYAICVLAGMAAAYLVGRSRWVSLGGNNDDFDTLTIFCVITGILGARLYHVCTHLWDFTNRPFWYVFAINEGGLAIYGGVAGGALAAWFICRRLKVSYAVLGDCIAPGLILGQAIGRLGNWFNQELYGDPTVLPWALHIDSQHRIPGFENFTTFHPTFLYEMLLNLLLFGILLLLEGYYRLGHGRVFALYVTGYGLIRFLMEELRLDPIDQVLGLRFNGLMALVFAFLGILAFNYLRLKYPGKNISVFTNLKDQESVIAEELSDKDAEVALEPSEYSTDKLEHPKSQDKSRFNK